ncbi:hypothetical protein Tco_0665449 [Tanacetum coccineum]
MKVGMSEETAKGNKMKMLEGKEQKKSNSKIPQRNIELRKQRVHNGNYTKCTAGTKVYAAGLQLLEDLLLPRG